MMEFFVDAYKDTPTFVIVLEAIAFFFGIISVYFAKQDNILVYPTGLISTIITVYLFYRAGYLGDAAVNIYFSIMSIYGWYMWTRMDGNDNAVAVSRTNNKEKLTGIAIFIFTIFVIYIIYKVCGYKIKVENYFDIFTSGIFFTAMYFMALKKIENWILWIIGDIISIWLCARRNLGILSLQYLIFTILAIMAYMQWRKTLKEQKQSPTLSRQ
ncbi:MAG TPA: nicotinamide riboside transporter PnuC [Flavobacterium sp.]|jgi:nicotinamide mononucleotide transporter